MNGAETLVQRLEAHGVTTVFALPGEENLAVVEAIGDSGISLVVVRHEQHAAFMASTHGRLTGRPGVCLATLGPGALNLLTGLAHAELGGWPLIAITGQKPIADNDEGSFQVVDITAAAAPVTRWATTIDDAREVGPSLDEAFNRALAGRPGAVLVELPEDIADHDAGPAPTNPLRLPRPAVPSPDTLDDVACLIDEAERPVLLAGGGANTALTAEAVREFAERTGIGVVATQTGKGALAESHPLSMRSLGIHRPDYAHLAIEPADLVIAVGYQPVEHPPLAWNPDEDKSIVHLANWPASIERGYRPSRQAVGDPATALRSLADRLRTRDRDRTIAIGDTIKRLLAEEGTRRDAARGPANSAAANPKPFPPTPLDVVRTVRSVLDPTDVVALDNGVYKIWFARHYPCEAAGTLLLDNALASMGAGLATAMEAARLDPGRRTLAVCGDGGFLMNVQDLETACRIGLDLTVLVLRDDAYGFIGWHQDEQNRPREAVDVGNPDYDALARAFGATGHQVTPDDDLAAVLQRALDEPGVSLVDCPIDYAQNEILESDLYERAKDARR